MSYYEAVYILDPNLTEEQLSATKADLRSKIEAVAGTEINELRSERRNLTFPIKKRTEGHYVIFRYQGPADSVGKLRVELKHAEQILRMSYIRVPDKVVAQQPIVAPPIPPVPVAEPAIPEPAVVEPPVESAPTEEPASPTTA